MNNPYFNLISVVWRYGKDWRMSIIGYYCAYVIAQSALGLGPYAFGKTINILQNFAPQRLKEVILWLSVGVVVLIIFWLFHGPARVVERKVALKIQQAFKLNFYEQLTHLPLNWHQNHHSGNIITRLNRAAISLRQFAESQFIYVETIVKFIISVSFLFWISIPIGLLSLITSFVVSLTVILFDRKLIPLYSAENEIENHVGAVLFDYINNMTTILTLRLGALTHANIWQRMHGIWSFFRKDVILNESKWCSVMILLAAMQALLLIGYIVHALSFTGTVMLGLVVMIFRYQLELNSVFYDLSIHYSELVRMNTDIQSVNPILDDFKRYAHLPKGAQTAIEWHYLSIKNLSFNHTNENSRGTIFKNINFNIKRGEKIALIGTSGAGKSTLLNLLGGLYTASEINLAINDVSFNSLEPLLAITTLIPQDPEIFENSLLFNITLDLITTEEEVMSAIKLAGFMPILNSLPLGLETDIREKGLNLSVGQKQRLALARGLFAARYSSLILMDEPTSSVDLPTEKEILLGVMKAYQRSAIIVSLHRLHLLPYFDSVLMLDEGKVIAQGATATLLHSAGAVRDLWLNYQKSSP